MSSINKDLWAAHKSSQTDKVLVNGNTKKKNVSSLKQQSGIESAWN